VNIKSKGFFKHRLVIYLASHLHRPSRGRIIQMQHRDNADLTLEPKKLSVIVCFMQEPCDTYIFRSRFAKLRGIRQQWGAKV
jgi:hypothetical protein